MSFSFEIKHAVGNSLARVGTITTPHGQIQTPAFIPVGTKATVKSVLPEAMADLGAQALLANAYHLYLQPGSDILDEAGGLGEFMNWPGPTITDSGGFQVLSLGVGFKKVLAMDAKTFRRDDVIADNKERLAHVDDEGVTFKSHLDGSMHRFTPEVSMQVQHQIGADIPAIVGQMDAGEDVLPPMIGDVSIVAKSGCSRGKQQKHCTQRAWCLGSLVVLVLLRRTRRTETPT